MKYLKTYENLDSLEVGDYIICYGDWTDTKGNLVCRKNYPHKIEGSTRDGDFWFISDDKNIQMMFDPKLMKKISDEEAEMILNAEKYNL